jgi:hypothetical protein
MSRGTRDAPRQTRGSAPTKWDECDQFGDEPVLDILFAL